MAIIQLYIETKSSIATVTIATLRNSIDDEAMSFNKTQCSEGNRLTGREHLMRLFYCCSFRENIIFLQLLRERFRTAYCIIYLDYYIL